jgi:3-deoxy-D-manno-octulosonic-acid transferase
VRRLYSALAYALAPLYCGALLWRGVRERGYWRRFGERFGLGAALASPSLWVHAASLGEVQAAAALVLELKRRAPLGAIVLTTSTASGADRGRALLGSQGVDVRYVPLDLPGSVRRFFDRVRPRLALVLETELWPNLYEECGRRGVPLVLASARISERSTRRYGLAPGLFKRALSNCTLLAAQSETDAARFRRLGAAPERTEVVGNIKFDFSVPAHTEESGRALRARYGGARPVWIAGSTREGEEVAALAAHERVRGTERTALLVIAPRHPPRFAEVAAWLESRGVRFARRSTQESCDSSTEVLLLDTLGELLAFYAAADVVFVGGSLVRVGGHNLLEPAALA